MAAVVLIREIDSLIDPAKLGAMQDFQLGWFWKIFNLLRVAPNYRLPFDDQFWSLTGAKTKGFWLTHCAPVLACYERQNIAGQTWVWHSGLVRLAEAGSQFGNLPANHPQEDVDKDKKPMLDSIKDLFLSSYKNYPKHIEPKSSEEAFYKTIKEFSRKQKIPQIDAAEFIASKCAEYSAATKKAGIPKQFIPYMGKWLRKGRYLDDPSEWVVSYQQTGKKTEPSMQQRLKAIDEMEY